MLTINTNSFYPVIMTDRLKESATFYTQHFGFESVFAADWYISLRMTQAKAPYELALLDPSHPTIPTAFQNNIVQGLILNFEVDDVDAAYAVMRESGAEIVHPLQDEEWGVRRFMLREPSGTLVNEGTIHSTGTGTGTRNLTAELDNRGTVTIDPDHATVAAVLAANDELDDASYSRRNLAGKAVTQNDPEDRAELDADTVDFEALDNETPTAMLVFLFEQTARSLQYRHAAAFEDGSDGVLSVAVIVVIPEHRVAARKPCEELAQERFTAPPDREVGPVREAAVGTLDRERSHGQRQRGPAAYGSVGGLLDGALVRAHLSPSHDHEGERQRVAETDHDRREEERTGRTGRGRDLHRQRTPQEVRVDRSDQRSEPEGASRAFTGVGVLLLVGLLERGDGCFVHGHVVGPHSFQSAMPDSTMTSRIRRDSLSMSVVKSAPGW
jgi:uncharacterized glyoxalase superfamily protein PhnB